MPCRVFVLVFCFRFRVALKCQISHRRFQMSGITSMPKRPSGASVPDITTQARGNIESAVSAHVKTTAQQISASVPRPPTPSATHTAIKTAMKSGGEPKPKRTRVDIDEPEGLVEDAQMSMAQLVRTIEAQYKKRLSKLEEDSKYFRSRAKILSQQLEPILKLYSDGAVEVGLGNAKIQEARDRARRIVFADEAKLRAKFLEHEKKGKPSLSPAGRIADVARSLVEDEKDDESESSDESSVSTADKGKDEEDDDDDDAMEKD